MQVLVWTCFVISLAYISRSTIIGSYVNFVFTFKELPNWFLKWLYHFTIPQVMYESSKFSTSSSTFVTLSFHCFRVRHDWATFTSLAFSFSSSMREVKDLSCLSRKGFVTVISIGVSRLHCTCIRNDFTPHNSSPLQACLANHLS